jgi:hypothetical protein
LKCVVLEEGLSSNILYITDIIDYNMRFILRAKPDAHTPHLFAQLFPNHQEPGGEHTYIPICAWSFSLHTSNLGLLVNVLEYWQLDSKGKEIMFRWVTDFPLMPDNVYQIMHAGRARWRIDNEMFNAVPNPGYNLEYNFGWGDKHLSVVLNHLTIFAFLVDQIQQLCDPLVQVA